jgi:signal transduction histidine kinase
MRSQRPTVLLLSSDPAFAREITEAWPRESELPEFVVLDGDLCGELQADTFDLAIADVSSNEKRIRLKQAIAATGKPVILAAYEASAPSSSGPIVELSRETEAWAAIVGLLGREILRRRQAESRVREADRARTAAETEATLGRYMAEMRHNANNALTSVLGNAELLLLEPGLSAQVVGQADTIRNMALRLHEIFQRFTSIEKELSVAARESDKRPAQARAAAAGSQTR